MSLKLTPNWEGPSVRGWIPVKQKPPRKRDPGIYMRWSVSLSLFPTVKAIEHHSATYLPCLSLNVFFPWRLHPSPSAVRRQLLPRGFLVHSIALFKKYILPISTNDPSSFQFEGSYPIFNDSSPGMRAAHMITKPSSMNSKSIRPVKREISSRMTHQTNGGISLRPTVKRIANPGFGLSVPYLQLGKIILKLIVIYSHKVCSNFLPPPARIVFLLILTLISPSFHYPLPRKHLSKIRTQRFETGKILICIIPVYR